MKPFRPVACLICHTFDSCNNNCNNCPLLPSGPNSNSGACCASVLSHPAALPGVLVLCESELAKYYQLQQVLRDADASAVAVNAAWWTMLRRTSGDLKDLDKLGIDLETSLAVIALASPQIDLVVTVIQAPVGALIQLDAAVDFSLPLSPTAPSNAGSRNPPPLLSPLLIQLRTGSKMTAYAERLGDDAMGIQGSRASLAGLLYIYTYIYYIYSENFYCS